MKHSQVKGNCAFGVVDEVFVEERVGDDVAGAGDNGIVVFCGAVCEQYS